MRTFTRTMIRRINGYTVWASDPQPVLTTRSDRAA
jgi:hypothetical protein